jgi:hypothetical protein
MSSRSTEPDSPSPVVPSEEKSSGTTPGAPRPLACNLVPVRRWPPDVDSQTGRLRSISAEEWQARQAELTRRLAEIDAQDDTPEGVYDEFMRNLDEERHRQGRPPAFEGF